MMISSNELLGFLLNGRKLCDSVCHADLYYEGNTLLAFDGDKIVFACELNELWVSWCKRQKYAVPNWGYEAIEEDHFYKVVERWVRFCVHRGVSGVSIVPPRRLLEQDANDGTLDLTTASLVASIGTSR